MKVNVNDYLNRQFPTKIAHSIYMVSKYAYGGQMVFCGKCVEEFPLTDVDITEIYMDIYDRRMIHFICPKCGMEDSEMLDLRYLSKADDRRLREEMEKSK